ncbi:MAG: MBL fold metallo-hydrolase [Gemmatimonadales bacterium]
MSKSKPYTVTFWGTRGSIPTPGAHTTRYGGNTPCIAVQTGGGKGDQLVVLDAGTGIRALGLELVAKQNGAVKVEILLSHAHWDHIQGLPHFRPFFAPGNTVRIWGTRQGTASLEAILRQQMDPAVFPVPLDALSAQLTVQQVDPGEFSLGEFRVRTAKVRHPGTTLAYRLTPAGGGPSMAYVTDNELGPGGHYDVPATWRRDFVAFLEGVDLLVHDAMYTPAELEQHRGWGHSTYEEAVALAQEARARRLVLFHHEPEHGDDAMDALLAAARRHLQQRGGTLDVLAAQEGMQVTL